MSYNYHVEKPTIFTEEGQIIFLGVRDTVDLMLKETGAFTLIRGISHKRIPCATTWILVACLDRLEEIGEIEKVYQPSDDALNHRVYIRGGGKG